MIDIVLDVRPYRIYSLPIGVVVVSLYPYGKEYISSLSQY